MQIRFKKLHAEAKMPTYATSGAACFDIYALVPEGHTFVWMAEPAALRTGISVEIPEGYVMMVYSRSGHGFKNDVRLSNCVGVIDSDYRGELMVKLAKDSYGDAMAIMHGDRVAQGMVIPVSQVEFVEVKELSQTERGNGGFGSTGA